MSGEQPGPDPRWKEDFPIEWEKDHYVTRRELAKFLTLGSALLAGVSGVLAALSFRRRPEAYPRVRIARSAEIPPGGSLLFRYPTPQDPCILLRAPSGQLEAYSQVCTHLSCAVVYRPGRNDLFCPCHHGVFEVEGGRPIAGPPTRRLPRIVLQESSGDIYATAVEV